MPLPSTHSQVDPLELRIQLLRAPELLSQPSSVRPVFGNDSCWCLSTAATSLSFWQHFDGLRNSSLNFIFCCAFRVAQNPLWIFWRSSTRLIAYDHFSRGVPDILGEHMVSCASLLQPRDSHLSGHVQNPWFYLGCTHQGTRKSEQCEYRAGDKTPVCIKRLAVGNPNGLTRSSRKHGHAFFLGTSYISLQPMTSTCISVFFLVAYSGCCVPRSYMAG